MTDADIVAAFPPHAIAVVGLAGRFPGAKTLDEFWDNVRSGKEALETFSDADLEAAGVPPTLRDDPLYVRRGTALEGADLFDAGFFGLSPREAQILDPQHRVFLECAWEALEHAGQTVDARKSIGVYGGASMNTYLLAQILRDPALSDAVGGYQLMLGNDKDFLCTRVSYKLDLRGPSMTIQTACSTSLVAVEVACRALRAGECDVALAGGVSITFPLRGGYLFQSGMILSPDGHCRPFDADAAGTRGGAGAGIVVLKRLSDALADRDTIHAVIRGAAVNNDGAGKVGYTAPSVDGQVEAIAMAQARAGVDARTIEYMEAHGTATPQGDPIEIAALTQVFRESTADIGFCRLGSLKANLGHLDAAAGVAGLIKTVMALSRREFPPLTNYRVPNPQLDLHRSPFTASAEGATWPAGPAPRRAGVSSFGIGGTNAHVVLEEAPPAESTGAARDDHLLVLSAKTPSALEQATANLADCLDQQPELALADVAWTLQVGRRCFPHRRAIVVQDREQAVRSLRQPGQAPVLTGNHGGGARPVAFLFSGQGSQYPAMGAGLYRAEPVYRESIDRCAALLLPHLQLDIRDVVLTPDSGEMLDQTHLTQPALFCTEYALAMLWMHWGVAPKAMLGHSVGEYVAAHLAGVLSLEDALLVVAERGRLLQSLPAGAMAAAHLPAAELRRRLGADVEIAAVNGPALCTISGPTEHVAATIDALEAAGVECRALQTSHAFHSAMMEPALARFEAVFQRIELSPPRIAYVSNVTGTWITSEQATSPAYYGRHLRQAVQFEAGVRTLAADANLFFLEVGPSNALTALVRANLSADRARLATSSLPHPRLRDRDGRAMIEAAGRMWLAGVPVAWEDMPAGAAPRRIPLPTYPFERQRYMVEARPNVPQRAPEFVHARTDDAAHLYLPTWSRHDIAPGAVSRLTGCWLVLGDAQPLTTAVVAHLQAAGARTVVVEAGAEYAQPAAERFHVRPGVAEDIDTVTRTATASHGQVAGAILLWTTAADATGVALDRLLGYKALVSLAGGMACSGRDTALRVIVVTAGAQSVIDEPVLDPAMALTFGPVLKLPAEIPGFEVRSVDIIAGNAAVSARSIAAEAASPTLEAFVAYRGKQRWVRRYEPLGQEAADSMPLPIKQGGVYLITGGLGGIGLKVAHWLAAQASVRLLLTTRRSLPPRDGWPALLASADADDWRVQAVRSIRDIEAAGGEVIAVAADTADRRAMSDVIERARSSWGPINGVIHAAGIAGDGATAMLQSADEIQAVVSPKVDGLGVLVDLLGDTPLDFVVLMSSSDAIVSTPGGCNYAAANAVLDAFVESAAKPELWQLVSSINWGPWREVGMAARRIASSGRQGLRDAFLRAALTPDAAMQALSSVLRSGRTHVVVTGYDLHRAIATLRLESGQAGDMPDERAEAAAAANTQARPSLSTGFEPPASDVERYLAEIWTELTGVTPIGVHDDFFELGGHSLLATRVLARISSALGVRLALRDVFEAPTIRLLAERIDVMATDREEILI